MMNNSTKIRKLTLILIVISLLFSSFASMAVPKHNNKAHFHSPMDFARKVYPLAKKAADKIGCDPKVLVAQAAHETDWGRRVPKHHDGATSYNLFGMKSVSPRDNRVAAPTKEYVNGKPRKEVAHFKAYSNYDESFMDYASLLFRSNRWRNALANADNPKVYLQELQKAGYATDPGYAKKIYNIYAGQLKNL